MSNVLEAIIKLPRFVKIRATNGDENNAIVEDKNERRRILFRRYYIKNRDWILQKKKLINSQPHIKQHNAEYHKKYYSIHRESLLSKSREYHRRRKNGIQMSSMQ